MDQHNIDFIRNIKVRTQFLQKSTTSNELLTQFDQECLQLQNDIEKVTQERDLLQQNCNEKDDQMMQIAKELEYQIQAVPPPADRDELVGLIQQQLEELDRYRDATHEREDMLVVLQEQYDDLQNKFSEQGRTLEEYKKIVYSAADEEDAVNEVKERLEKLVSKQNQLQQTLEQENDQVQKSYDMMEAIFYQQRDANIDTSLHQYQIFPPDNEFFGEVIQGIIARFSMICHQFIDNSLASDEFVQETEDEFVQLQYRMNEIDKNRKQGEEISPEIAQFMDQIEYLQKENQIQKETIKQLKLKYKQTLQETIGKFERLSQQQRVLDQDMEQTSKQDFSEVVVKIEELQQKMTEQFNQFINRGVKEQLSNSFNEMKDRLAESLFNLRRQVYELMYSYNKSETKLTSSKNFEKEQQDLINDVKLLHDLVYKSCKDELMSQLPEILKSSDEFKQSCQQYEQRIQILEQNTEKLKQLDQMQNECKEKQKQIEQLQKQIVDTNQNNSQQQSTIEELKKQIDALNNTLNNSDGENVQEIKRLRNLMKEKELELQSEKQELGDQLQNKDEELNSIKNQISEQQSAIQTLQNEKKQFLTTIQSLEQQIQEQKFTHNEERDANVSKQDQAIQLQDEVASLQKSNTGLLIEIERLNKCLSDEQKKSSELQFYSQSIEQQKTESLHDQSNEKIKELEESKQKLEKENTELKRIIEEQLNEQIDHNNEKIEIAVKEMKKDQKDEPKITVEQILEMENLPSDLEELKQKVLELDNEYKMFKQLLGSEQDENAEILNNTIKEKEEEIQTAKNALLEQWFVQHPEQKPKDKHQDDQQDNKFQLQLTEQSNTIESQEKKIDELQRAHQADQQRIQQLLRQLQEKQKEDNQNGIQIIDQKRSSNLQPENKDDVSDISKKDDNAQQGAKLLDERGSVSKPNDDEFDQLQDTSPEEHGVVVRRADDEAPAKRRTEEGFSRNRRGGQK